MRLVRRRHEHSFPIIIERGYRKSGPPGSGVAGHFQYPKLANEVSGGLGVPKPSANHSLTATRDYYCYPLPWPLPKRLGFGSLPQDSDAVDGLLIQNPHGDWPWVL